MHADATTLIWVEGFSTAEPSKSMVPSTYGIRLFDINASSEGLKEST